MVGYTDNEKYRSFDVSQEWEQDDTKLKEHDVLTKILNPNAFLYEGPVRITDTLASNPVPMATFLWQNHGKERVTYGYAAIYFLKRTLVKGMLHAMDVWEEGNPYPQYKLGIEV